MGTGGYIFAGGGTGGHLTPAIAVADELRSQSPDLPIEFFGAGRAIETTIVVDAGYAHTALDIPGSADVRRRPLAGFRQLRGAAAQARRRLQELQPRAVVGCGGFASVPTVWAAWRLGIPTVLLEQNVLPGRATRWLSRIADVVCLSFEESRDWLPRRARTVVTGNPVRRRFQACSAPIIGSEEAGTDVRRLLILGGSLGARGLNEALLDALARSPAEWADWEIVHQTGAADCEVIRERYAALGLSARVEPFLSPVELPDLMQRADLVISRGGATTLAELACIGAATIVVPWSGAADDHQTLNARWYAERGAMLHTVESAAESSAGRPPPGLALHDVLTTAAGDAALRERLRGRVLLVARPDAAVHVIDVLRQVVATPR